MNPPPSEVKNVLKYGSNPVFLFADSRSTLRVSPGFRGSGVNRCLHIMSHVMSVTSRVDMIMQIPIHPRRTLTVRKPDLAKNPSYTTPV